VSGQKRAPIVGGFDVSFPPIISRCLSVLAAAILSATLAGPVHANSAASLTLQDLIDGETFTTDNGLLFSGFSADVDLEHVFHASHILVRVGESGFSLIGPFVALAGETGRIDLSYTVTSESDDLGISKASLYSPGEVLGTDAGFEVTELLKLLGGAEVELSTFADAPGLGGDADLFDEIAALGALPLVIEVEKQIVLSGGSHPTTKARYGHGSMLGWDGAGIELIEQRFDTGLISAPEPGGFALIGMGLVGLAGLRRRRRAH
jgi:hypothetical protein